MLADTLLLVGFALLIAGLWGAFGWPWAAITGGVLLSVAGARLQATDPRTVSS